MSRTLLFKALEWYTEENDDSFDIYCVGMTQDNKSVMIKIVDFSPFVYIELPELRVGEWSDVKIEAFMDFVNKKCGERPPISWTSKAKWKVMKKEPANFIRVAFKTQKDCRNLEYKFSRELYIPGLHGSMNSGKFRENEFKVHEGNVEPFIKFITMRKIIITGWLEVEEYIDEEDEDLSEEDRKFSTADIDMCVHWKNVNPRTDVSDSIQINPKILSFDIEEYSSNHRSTFPDASLRENCIFQISGVVSNLLDPPEKYKNYLLTLLDSDPIENVDIRAYDLSEKDLLLGFKDLVNEENPDIIIGYNFLKYDYHTMILRSAEVLGISLSFRTMGRIIGKKVPIVEKKWQSSAYGEQKFSYLAPQGRLNIDIQQEIERNYKYDTYKLGYVSQELIKETKEDMPIKQMFMLFNIAFEIHILLGDKNKRNTWIKTADVKKVFELSLNKLSCTKYDEDSILETVKKRVYEIIGKYDTIGHCKEFKKLILEAESIDDLRDIVKKIMKKIGEYNVKDSYLPLRLLQKLHILKSLGSMANITGIPMSWLQTRGQQIKILAQIYADTMFGNYVVDNKKYFEKIKQKYQGATVIPPIPSSKKRVLVTDFKSLYPSIIIAFNIDWTTHADSRIVYKDDDDYNIPDDGIHFVIEWDDDHIGCIHDKEIRKTKIKKEDILCLGENGAKKRVRYLKHTIDEKGEFHNQGLMPHKLSCLLKARSDTRKRIEVIKAILKMNKGDEDGIKMANKMKINIIKKGSLTEKEIENYETEELVLDKKQLAEKISANSGYGGFGSEMSYLPLIDAAASVTAIGRQMIKFVANEVKKNYTELSVVYGDTDSVMIDVSSLSLEQIWEFGEKFTKEITKKLPAPMELEFEGVYEDYNILSKKRYFANKIDKTGKIVGPPIKKGIVLTRRDNCHFLKDVYGKMVDMIKKDESKQNVMWTLYDMIYSLFTRNACHCCIRGSIPDTKFTLFKGIKTVEDYDKDAHVSHVMLARKMIARGQEVPPNTRLEYVFLKTKGNKEELQGEKAEDLTYYRDNKRRLKLEIDPLYYLERQLIKPLTELINVKYPPKKIKYKPLYDDIFDRVILDLKLRDISYRNNRIFDFKEKWYQTKRPDGTGGAVMTPATKEGVINYIFKELKKNLSSKKSHKEIGALLKRWTYQTVITRLRRQNGLKKIQPYKPKKGSDEILLDENFLWDHLLAHQNYSKVVQQIKKINQVKITVK